LPDTIHEAYTYVANRMHNTPTTDQKTTGRGVLISAGAGDADPAPSMRSEFFRSVKVTPPLALSRQPKMAVHCHSVNGKGLSDATVQLICRDGILNAAAYLQVMLI
jgi:hypothetical protein